MSLVVWCVLLGTGSSPLQDDRYGNRFFSESGCDEARLKAAIDEVRGSSKVPQLSAKLYRTFKLQTATHSYFCSNRQEMKGGLMLYDFLLCFPGDFCCAVLTYMIFDLPRSRARTLRARMKPSRPMGQILPAWRGKGSWTQWLAEMMRSEELLGKRWKTWKGYEKKILFKIVQKGSSECYVYTRSVFPCVFPCFARLQGPRC